MFARVQTRRLTGTRLHPINQRAADLRLALLLTYITLVWMTIEGAASLLLGWASRSLLLEAFGIDSVIELFSAAVLLWRLRIEASGTATSEHVNVVEHRAARLVGYSLYALVVYVVLNSGIDHMRLPVDRFDDRIGGDLATRLVVAGQHRRSRVDPFPYQRGARSNSW